MTRILTKLNCICKHSVYRMLDIFNKNLNMIQCHRNIKAVNDVSYVINSKETEFKNKIKSVLFFLSVTLLNDLSDLIFMCVRVCSCICFSKQVLLLIIILISIQCACVCVYPLFCLPSCTIQSDLIWSHSHCFIK